MTAAHRHTTDLPEKITPEQAAMDVYALAATCIEKVARAYQGGGEIAENLKSRTASAGGRLSGLSYKAQTYGAIYQGFQNVETQKIIDTVRNPDISLREKISNISGHMGENFSHEATVALGFKLGKAALLGGLVAMSAPGAVIAGAYIAVKYGSHVLQGGAEYFLSSPQGHHLEVTLAEKVKKSLSFTKNLWRAHNGADPEYAALHDMSEKLDKAAHADDKQAQNKNHHHGHGHHAHQKAHHTLQGDLKSAQHAIMHPIETLRSAATAVQDDCTALARLAENGWQKVRQQVSKFSSTAPATESTAPENSGARQQRKLTPVA